MRIFTRISVNKRLNVPIIDYSSRYLSNTAKLTNDNINKYGVFCNNDISLKYIDIYGFDYDYTLVNYTKELDKFIYKSVLSTLVKKYSYSKVFLDFVFDDSFAIRGLHFDKKNGVLLKVDCFNHVQTISVFKGRKQVTDFEVIEMYSGTHIANLLTEKNGLKIDNHTFPHIIDQFTIPTATIIADVIQYFIDHNIHYDPETLYNDVEECAREVHKSGLIHREILSDTDKYFTKNDKIGQYLRHLKNSKKKLFILTNNSFEIINRGLSALIDKNWSDLFDLVITDARKPSFFNHSSRPFKMVDILNNIKHWQRVDRFLPGNIYSEGNVFHLMKFTNWRNMNILYFGDNLYHDLMNPFINLGWRSCAIINELEFEIEAWNDSTYLKNIHHLNQLEKDISNFKSSHHDYDIYNNEHFINLKNDRRNIRIQLKDRMNKNFGSVFRTHTNPTLFTHKLIGCSDLYTSRIDNMFAYRVDHTFYPQRRYLPHEHFLR